MGKIRSGLLSRVSVSATGSTTVSSAAQKQFPSHTKIPPPSSLSKSTNTSTSPFIHKTKTGRIQKVKSKSKKQVSFSPNVTSSEGTSSPRKGGIRRYDEFLESSKDNLKTILRSPTTVIQVTRKKQKKRLKKEAFRRRIEVIKETERAKWKTEQRKKTVIVGDMEPLLNALVENEESSPAPVIQTNLKGKKRKMSVKKRELEIAQGLEYFAAGLAKN